MSQPRTILAPALALGALALTLACGGASAPKQSATSAPSTPATAPKEAPEPFWLSDSPERPHRAAPIATASSTPSILRLTESEAALVAARAGLPETAAAAPAEKPAVPLRIVTGLRSTTYHLADATSLQPYDLTSAVIQALVPNGAGGFDTLAGVGHSDGTFSITNVPVGYYWLKFGVTYHWTNADHVEWVMDGFGRTDAVTATAATPLVMNASNLSPWADTDELFLNVPNQGATLRPADVSPAVTNAPAAGHTALNAYTWDFGQGFLGLLDSTKGDQAYLNQLTTRAVGATPYRALGRTWSLPALVMPDAAATNANGSFLDLPQTSTVRLNWRRSAFAAMSAQVNPSATVASAEFGLWASPLGHSFGLPWNSFQLFTYDDAGATAATDLDLGDLTYGNPYPAAWSLAAEGYFSWSLSYLAPGAATPITLTRSSYTANATLPTAVSPFSPLITPVRNPRINGKTLFETQVAVGTSPTLTWDAPSTGTPTGYFVRIMELRNDSGASRLLTRSVLRTTTRAITVPPGHMVPGTTYVITISALRMGAVPFAQYPFQTALPYGSAPMMSAIVAP